jgi:uncharacterized protein (TIGR03083 family)
MSMNPLEPISVLDLFLPERAALVDLLTGLAPGDWMLPTVCAGWSVHDVALHILGGDLTNISRRRDEFLVTSPNEGEDFVAFINRINEQWVDAARRLSPRVIIDLLRLTGPQLHAYFSTLDLDALGGGVSWAGLDPAPVWLDVAREYTERWLHQQHIRLATSRPDLHDPRFMRPVLATFVYALPVAYRHINAPHGSTITFNITGDSGGMWSLLRESGGWSLYSGPAPNPIATIAVDESTAWRLLTRGISPDEARPALTVEGDPILATPFLHAVAIIA